MSVMFSVITQYNQRNYRMEAGILKILVYTVSLKLKFKCRVRVEWKNGLGTQEVAINDGLYRFDEELSLRLQQGVCELNIALITDKGSLYSGGKIKLNLNEMKHSIGEIVRLPIQKCIDRQAWIQTKILWISQNQDDSRNKKDISFTQKRALFNQEVQTPEKNRRQNLVIEANYGQTKSEYGFKLPLKSSHPLQFQKKKIGATSRRDLAGQYSIHRQSRQQRAQSPQRSSPRRQSPQEWLYRQEINEVKRQVDYSASKLKNVLLKYKQEQEKGKIERQKRKQMQVAEQSHKMQIVRLKLNKQECQRQLLKKTNTIKELLSINSLLKDADKKTSLLKQQLRKKQQEVNFLQDKIGIQNQQFQEIKATTQYQINRYAFQLDQLKQENYNIRKNQNQSIEQLKIIINTKEEEISCAEAKRILLEQDLERYKQIKTELELKSHQQIIRLEKNITLLKRQAKSLSQQLVSSKNISEKHKLQLSQTIASLEKERINLSKTQVQKNELQGQLQESEQKLREIKRYKDKYQQQIDKYKTIKEEYLWTKRKFEVAVEENYKLEERLKISQQQNQIYIDQINNFIEKQRMDDGKLNSYQQQLKQNRVLVQRQKRNQENYQKDSLVNQEKQRHFKMQLKKKQMQIIKLQSEIESLNLNLGKMKEAIKLQTSKKVDKQYNPIQQWEESKLKSILESQRFLEMEIISHKQNYAEIQVQYTKAKQELQKCAKNEMDWREQERIWQSQKQKYCTQNNRLMKQIKEMTKRLSEEEAKIFNLTQKLQKQRKLSKQQEQKTITIQANLRKIIQQKDNIALNYSQRQENCKSISNQFLVAKKQIQYIQNEKQTIQKINEGLSMENKKIQEEVFLITKKLKDQQDKYSSGGKKIKQELNKSEARAINFKKQGEKFKQNLRNIIVDSIISKIPRNQQEYELILKKKQEKLGLTLTNELLIRLENYLKELHRHQLQLEQKLYSLEKQLMTSREESIMKTNQFQNNEGQLKNKMEELLQNLQKMKQIYQTRQMEFKKELNQQEWQIINKNEQISKLKQVKQSLSEEIQNLNEKLQNQQKQEMILSGQIDKLKMKIKEANSQQISLLDQIRGLEQYSLKLQEDISNSKMQIEELSLQKQRNLKIHEEIQNQLQNCKQSLTEISKQKKEMKEMIFSLQSQTQELKLIHSHCQKEMQNYQKQKSEETNLVRTLMKEKQNLLRQYLESQQKISLLQNKQFEMNDKIIQLSEDIDKVKRNHQQDKKNLKILQGQVKSTDLEIEKKQCFIKQIGQKYKDLQRAKNTLEQTIERIKTDREKQKRQYELMIRSKETQSQQIKDQLTSKNSKLQQLQGKILKEQKRYQQLQLQMYRLKSNIASLNEQRLENQQKLNEYIQKEEQIDIELFSYKTQVTKLREELLKTQEQLKERDLKNYQLSSDIYRLQTESSNQMAELSQKIMDQQISIAKYEQICEQYLSKISQLEKDNQLLAKTKNQSEEEMRKLQNKINLLSSECDSIQEKRSSLQTELQKAKDTYKKFLGSKDDLQKQMKQAFANCNSRLQRKQLQFIKLKKQNAAINQLLQTMDQKLKDKQRQLNQQMKKGLMHQQSSKKMQLQLRTGKQNWKQLLWNSQREIKKLIQSKVRFLNDIQLTDKQGLKKLGDSLKGLQESILDAIKKYADA